MNYKMAYKQTNTIMTCNIYIIYKVLYFQFQLKKWKRKTSLNQFVSLNINSTPHFINVGEIDMQT